MVSFPPVSPPRPYTPPLSSPILATCPAHLILLNFITGTIFDEQYKSFSSSLCSLLRYLVPPGSKHSPQHHVLKHPQLPSLPQCQRPSFTPVQNNRQNYTSIYTYTWIQTFFQFNSYYKYSFKGQNLCKTSFFFTQNLVLKNKTYF